MKTIWSFLNRGLTARTRLRIRPNPLSCLCKTWITVVSLAFVFIGGKSVVPRDFVLEAHLEATLFARNLRVDRISLV